MEEAERFLFETDIIKTCEDRCKNMIAVRTVVTDLMRRNGHLFRLTRHEHNGYAHFCAFNGNLQWKYQRLQFSMLFVVHDRTFEECITISAPDLHTPGGKVVYQLCVSAGADHENYLDTLKADSIQRAGTPENDFVYRCIMAYVVEDPKNGKMTFRDSEGRDSLSSGDMLEILKESTLQRPNNGPKFTFGMFRTDIGDPFDHGQLLRALANPSFN